MNTCDRNTRHHISRFLIDRLGVFVFTIALLVVPVLYAPIANSGDVVSIRYGNGLSTYHAHKYRVKQSHRYASPYKYSKKNHYKGRYYKDKHYQSRFRNGHGRDKYRYGRKLYNDHRYNNRYKDYIYDPRGNLHRHRGGHQYNGRLGIYYGGSRGGVYYQTPIR